MKMTQTIQGDYTVVNDYTVPTEHSLREVTSTGRYNPIIPTGWNYTYGPYYNPFYNSNSQYSNSQYYNSQYYNSQCNSSCSFYPPIPFPFSSVPLTAAGEDSEAAKFRKILHNKNHNKNPQYHNSQYHNHSLRQHLIHRKMLVPDLRGKRLFYEESFN
jgi:hypothetical protein